MVQLGVCAWAGVIIQVLCKWTRRMGLSSDERSMLETQISKWEAYRGDSSYSHYVVIKLLSDSIEMRGGLHQFARAAATKYHKPGGLNNRNLLSYSSRAQKFEIKALIGSVPSKGCEEEYISPLSPSSQCFLKQSFVFLAYRSIAPISAFLFTWCSPCHSESRC